MPYQQALNAVGRAQNQTINVRIWPSILDDAIDEFSAVSAEATQVKILGLAEEESSCGVRKPASHIAEPMMLLLFGVSVHDVCYGLAKVREQLECVLDRLLQLVGEIDDDL